MKNESFEDGLLPTKIKHLSARQDLFAYHFARLGWDSGGVAFIAAHSSVTEGYVRKYYGKNYSKIERRAAEYKKLWWHNGK